MHDQLQVQWRGPPSLPKNTPSFHPTPESLTINQDTISAPPTTTITAPLSDLLSPLTQDSQSRSATTRPQRRIRLATDFIKSDFWFHDGNIVIIAGQAAFKVHRGQLERHSEVFLGLFAVPQPPAQEQDLVDGCPCVEFHDSPSDVFYFLSALYDGLYFTFPRANDFPAVAAVLRLATKYMVEPLRIRCLHRLHLDWPHTLLGWDKREAVATDSSGRYLPRDICPHPILVIQLALEMGIPTILPAAMYDLSRYGPSRILAGAKKPTAAYDIIIENRVVELPESSKNGTGGPSTSTSTSTTASSASSSTSISSPDVVKLSHPLLCQTLRGREASQRYIATFLSRELCNRPPAPECLNKHDPALQQHCTESFYYIMLNVLRSVGGIACGRDADPLFTLLQAQEMLSRTDFTTLGAAPEEEGGEDGAGGEGGRRELKRCGLRMCEVCKADFAKAVVRSREEVWRLLPTWFELV